MSAPPNSVTLSCEPPPMRGTSVAPTTWITPGAARASRKSIALIRPLAIAEPTM
jgi:hypothetical protein